MRKVHASNSVYSKLASLAAFAGVVFINWGISATSIVGYPPLTMMFDVPEWVIPSVSISIVLTLVFVLLAVIKEEPNTWYKFGPMVYLGGVATALLWLFTNQQIQFSF